MSAYSISKTKRGFEIFVAHVKSKNPVYIFVDGHYRSTFPTKPQAETALGAFMRENAGRKYQVNAPIDRPGFKEAVALHIEGENQ